MADVDAAGRKQLPPFKLFGTVIDSDETRQKKRPPPPAAAEQGKDGAEPAKEAAPAAALPCPRCKSRETKFCYFNNYNVNQPRHFCKACHRYWTAGGALRNVPANAERRRNRVLSRAAGVGAPDSFAEVDRWLLRHEQMRPPPAAAAAAAMSNGAGEAR